MRRIGVILVFCLTAFVSNAQGGVMLELGGPTGYYSVNYVCTVQLPKSSAEIRLGYSTYRLFGIEGGFRPDVIVPFGLAYTIPGVKRLSVGAGLTFSGIQRYVGNDLKMNWSTAGFESVSFRFLMKEHFTGNLTAYLLNEPQKPWRAWGGLALTYLF